MPSKIFRDPLYNYVSIDRARDGWLLELLDCPEVQRLRRIHQLGVSCLTYPGADHNRLAHSLGVLHLMQQVWEHLHSICNDAQVNRAREPLLAAALLHDVGHGPFSHLFEPCLGSDHETWSVAVILSEDAGVNKILKAVDPYLPRAAADLVNQTRRQDPSWMKFLVSSDLDMDRLDYLRRDSLFTGASYGHFDWYRLLNTCDFHEHESARDLVWPEKSMLAIEEYLFARYYMYQNVYLHRTTRGFEKLIEAMWRRARSLWNDGADVGLLGPIADFWKTAHPSVPQYLAIEEYTVLFQIQQWTTCKDRALSDLARRFLHRHRLVAVHPPVIQGAELGSNEWEEALASLVRSAGYDPPEAYCLKDQVKAKYALPYNPEKEKDEASVATAIRIKVAGESSPVEISTLLPRLRPLLPEPGGRVRYYVPDDLRTQALALRANWK